MWPKGGEEGWEEEGGGGDSKRAVLVLQNDPAYAAQRRSFTTEDEAWKSFLENPLTAATKAMMSINGDEDSAAALGLLYDYYKHQAGHSITPLQDTSMANVESRIQVLKGPFNILLPNHLIQDKRAAFPSPDTTATVSIAAVPNYATVKTEDAAHGFSVATPSACSDARGRRPLGDAFERQLVHRARCALQLQQPRSGHAAGLHLPESFKDSPEELRMSSIVAPEDYSAFDSVPGSDFEYTLEASKSLRQKTGDGTMTYLNKGQFYPIGLREIDNSKGIQQPITKVRIFVSVNCLSTDFSSQKGVKGLPLNLQIDTYSYNNRSNKPIHRAYCQIKVFCDKGAERKIRDEERKQSRRKSKLVEPSSAIGAFADAKVPLLQKRNDESEEVFDAVMLKNPTLKGLMEAESEEVFDAVMLKNPTLKGLMEAISEKYELPLEKVGKVYKKCKKGILVNMDDNIIKHYSNEDTFQISMDEIGGMYKLTLTEI
ncbi:hypothetical protein CRUP_018516 [Coryphaenoides rupestris]|nr:hypothetical protein CRUP_018516 [Coryphaenoides rupestris]